MKILAFDPGETTGYAIVEFTPSERSIQVGIPQVGIFTGIDELYYLANSLFPTNLLEHDPKAPQVLTIFTGIEQVVIEDYVIYPNRAQSHIGSKVYTAREIGRIEYAAYPFGLTMAAGSIVLQSASMAKQRWPTGRLKSYIDLYDNDHVNDAIRHAFTWIERHFKRPLEMV